jgi:hypothetical protein
MHCAVPSASVSLHSVQAPRKEAAYMVSPIHMLTLEADAFQRSQRAL